MSEAEAQELLDYVALDRGPDSATVYGLASGQGFVVRLKSDDYWLWSFGDYSALRQAHEDAGIRHVKERKRKQMQEVSS